MRGFNESSTEAALRQVFLESGRLPTILSSAKCSAVVAVVQVIKLVCVFKEISSADNVIKSPELQIA